MKDIVDPSKYPCETSGTLEGQEENGTCQDCEPSGRQTPGRGQWLARQIVKWEKSWIASRTIPDGRAGGNKGNVKSWLEDEGFLLFTKEWIGQTKESKTTIYI